MLENFEVKYWFLFWHFDKLETMNGWIPQLISWVQWFRRQLTFLQEI